MIKVLLGLLLLMPSPGVVAQAPPPPSPDPARFEKLLLPVFVERIPGSGGISWWSILRAVNVGTEAIEYLPAACLSSPVSCLPLSPRQGISPMMEQEVCTPPSSSGSYPGAFIWIERSKLSQLLLSLRLYNSANELTGGIEVPIVRESDVSTGSIQLIGLPASRPDTRMTLRIYDFASHRDAQVVIRYFDSCGAASTALAEEVVSLQNASSFPEYFPTHISIDVPTEVASAKSLRIEIIPLTEGVKLWAVASINTAEGQVSLFASQRVVQVLPTRTRTRG